MEHGNLGTLRVWFVGMSCRETRRRNGRFSETIGETWAGTLDLQYVSKRFYEGRLEPKSIVDELSPDMPVNCILKAALEIVADLLENSENCEKLLRLRRRS